jgi:uncharacterized protein YndB with AHSA1/START domain
MSEAQQPMSPDAITVEVVVAAPIDRAWEAWTAPEHITKWCFASDDWEAPRAESDLRTGGKFVTIMAAKDGSAKFDFGGEFTDVVPQERADYRMGDGRRAHVRFAHEEGGVRVTETFEIEHENPAEMQRAGWQAILENFKKYAESL